MKIITLTGTKFAVRSGGHNPNAGFASIDGSGVLIDLSQIDNISLSPDKKVLSAGTGNRIGDVQRFIDPYGLSVVTGVSNGVGASGPILGGESFWIRCEMMSSNRPQVAIHPSSLILALAATMCRTTRYGAFKLNSIGLNLTFSQVVLGSSKVVNANAKENSDLFQVIKGGGNNFGRSTSPRGIITIV